MKRILSMFLALCMVVTLLQVTAVAEGIHTTIGTSGEIINFTPLTETEKTRPLGTSVQDLELPETLTATVRTALPLVEDSVQDSGSPDEDTVTGNSGVATPTIATEPEWDETTVDIPVKWESTPEYDMGAEGEYVFTPVIEGYTVKAELPEITVTVGEAVMGRWLAGTLSATTYEIWVGGVQVTDDNKDDVLGIANGDGATVTYNPTDGILTLNGATIIETHNGTWIDSTTFAHYGIYANTAHLEIEMVGSNTVIGKTGSDIASIGIYTDGTLTLSGSGNLYVSGGTGNFSAGIYSAGNITIEGGTVTAVSEDAGQTSVAIASNGDITISNGAVEASASTSSSVSHGMMAAEGFTINNSEVTASGKTGLTAVGSSPITISGGKVTATGSQAGIIGAVAVMSGTLTVKSDAKALDGSLTTSDYANCTVTASTNKNGDGADTYNAANLAYKYLKVEPAAGVTEQFNLAPGGTYYFDLSGEKDKIGTVYTAQPDTTLHYVPFTYAGTVNAYSLASAMAITQEQANASKSDRSLFVGDYNIGTSISWNSLNTASLIFGKTFDTNYTLRSLSVGSSKTGSAPGGSDHIGQPNTNEWDQILTKSGSTHNTTGWIKNWNSMLSWGQDASAAVELSRAYRGGLVQQWAHISPSSVFPNLGFRPALEVLSPDTLTSDGLKAVTLNLNGGSLKGSTANINIICAGDNFTAPSGDGLTAPSGKVFGGWKDTSDTTYAVGATVPNTVTGLTAQWKALDATAPAITSVNTSNTSGTYTTGDTLSFVVNLNENVTVNTGGGTPYLSLQVGSQTRKANYEGGNGTTSLRFSYTVQAGDVDKDEIQCLSPIMLNGGTIKDAAGNNANLIFSSPIVFTGILVDALPPSITAQPTSQTVNEGLAVPFVVTASSAASLSYQWQLSIDEGHTFTDIDRATTKGFTIFEAEYAMNGYLYRCVVTNSAGTVYSNPAKLTVNRLVTVPDAPTNVTATAGDGQASVSFMAPASNGGASITSYTVTSNPGGLTRTGNTSPITVGGLTNGIMYTFTVTATNSAGTGAASAPSNRVTPSEPLHAYSISGRVVDGIDGLCILNGAKVDLKDTSGTVIATINITSGYSYSFSNIPAGVYSIVASASGYISRTVSSITVSNADVTGINFDLFPFYPVTDITMTNAVSVQAGVDLSLAGTVSPNNATNQSIVWSVVNANGTGATIVGSTFRATLAGTATVKATVANGSTTSSDYTKTFDITVTTAPVVIHTITSTTSTGGSISPSGSVTVNSGTSQTFTITPTSNYSIADVKVDGVSQGRIASYTFSNVTANHTISAIFSYNGGGSGGGSSSNDNSSSVIVTPPEPDKPNSPTQGEIKVPGTVDGKGNITVNITNKAVTDAFDKALADAKKNGNEQNGITVNLRVDTGSKTGSNVTVNLPKTVQDTIIAKKIVNTIVVVDNPDIRIGMDLATVQEINKQAKSDVNITATRADSGKLTGDAKKAIGSRPVFDLKVNYGSGKQVQSFGSGSVSVTIPYTLGANEKAGNVQAVYVDAKDKVHWLTNSVYDSVEQVLRFSTDHFSTYGIGYKQTNTAFTDIAAHWAKEDIEFVVSRGLFSGTSNTTFSPNTAMTRGMFVTALGRLANADVSSYAKSSFTDVKSDAYYMGYIEWAKNNNIVNGVGNNKFVPDQSITLEQMAVIMSNYAMTIGYTLPKVHVENTFVDNGKISTYAKEAVKQMQMAGVIRGKNGNLFDPQGTATRADVSAVLRRFVELAISSDMAQGWTMNDSGKWMYYENGKPVTGKKDIDGGAYTFDQYGVTADVPKNLRYTTYTVQKGDSFWSVSRRLGCPMSELERLNNKSRFSLILPGDVLRVPEK